MSKRNRERRQQRKQQPKPAVQQPRTPAVPEPDRAEVAAFLRNFEELVATPEPVTWPGACDASLARPDLIKQELAEFAIHREPGRAKCRQLERDLANGLLHGIRDLNHWGM